MGNIVAIVGRPNVGKSTLFNRLTETRQAIVDEFSGVTRDRIYGQCFWNGVTFSVIDTGGYVSSPQDIFESEIRKQILIAIEEADKIIFMVDVENGITDLDAAVADLLRRSAKQIFLAVNKVDNAARKYEAGLFYKLGLGNLFTLSAISGSGTGELLDALVDSFSGTEESRQEELPRFAIVGRPNVGKSTLINTLLEEERQIVTEVSGTTRDAVDILFNKFNHRFYLVDTAGIRKKTKVKENLEFYSVMRSIRAIEHADVCFLLLDARLGIEGQDINIFRLIQRNQKGLVIAVNKWDLIEKDHHSLSKYAETIREKISPFQDVPIHFVSALEQQRILKLLDAGMRVYENRKQRIPTAKLNTVFQEAVRQYPPPAVKGKYIKIKYVTQLPTPTPVFAFFANLPQYIKEPYKRFLENTLRKNFHFQGVPVNIVFRKK
ncbi:MAG: ribosome biogenesis GTPase Der [Chlorobi bacterium]|nr:ribosome biogenesis GTPase Der [Chlorobiota bacterium]